jgi:hypothetical protein
MTCSLSDPQLVSLSPSLETADHHPVVLDTYRQAAFVLGQTMTGEFGLA